LSVRAFIERIRATAAGLRAAAERVGSRLLGVAEDVWHYATGERGAERASIGVEHRQVQSLSEQLHRLFVR